MARKFIKNCTGDDCESEKSSKSRCVISNFWSRIIFYVLFLGFVGACVYVLLFADFLRIKNITIVGTQELNAQELQQKISNSIAGKYLNFVPKNNFLFVSQKRVENLLKDDYKKIRSAAVMRKFPDYISVNIDERKALLVWCSAEKCFLLDENGTAYSEADFASPELMQNNLLQIADNSGRSVVIGEKVIEQDYEQFALAIKDITLKAGYAINEQYWTPSRMSQEINVKTQQGFDVYFSTQFSLETAVQNLALIVKKEISDEQKSNLAYIDLRNESKVFYKLNTQEPVGGENGEQVQNVITSDKKEEKKK